MKGSPLEGTLGEPLTRVKAGHDLAAVFKNLVSNLVGTLSTVSYESPSHQEFGQGSDLQTCGSVYSPC